MSGKDIREPEKPLGALGPETSTWAGISVLACTDLCRAVNGPSSKFIIFRIQSETWHDPHAPYLHVRVHSTCRLQLYLKDHGDSTEARKRCSVHMSGPADCALRASSTLGLCCHALIRKYARAMTAMSFPQRCCYCWPCRACLRTERVHLGDFRQSAARGHDAAPREISSALEPQYVFGTRPYQEQEDEAKRKCAANRSTAKVCDPKC